MAIPQKQRQNSTLDYRKGRSREGPDDILKDFKGFLQTDGYVTYESFEKREGITVLNCMTHARRKFMYGLQNDNYRCEHASGLWRKDFLRKRSFN